METKRFSPEGRPNAANCRWAVPTLFLPPPIWMVAWDAPWTCLRNARPRVLENTELCATCPRWEAPAAAPAATARRRDGRFDAGC